MSLYPQNAAPVRYPSGVAFSEKDGVLAAAGMPSQVWYHQFWDDFDTLLGITSAYTVSKGGAGSAALSAADGGTGVLTTVATNNDYVGIQLPAASFALPQGNTQGKKLFYGIRMALSDITASSFVAGLINTTSTLFGGGSITDGIYFQKSSGGTVLNIIVNNSSTPVTTVIPAASYSLVNATTIDLAFSVSNSGSLLVYAGAQLFGYIPTSGTGTTLPTRGPCLRLTPSLSSTVLNLSAGVQTAAVAVKSMTIDFHYAMKER